ncbi:hypothetical protein ACFFYR_14885 [Paraburkholderia dipogonis]|uniref:hypothetical protein n=1 Tax=Paraburkholderia dipogonis TaxID=1211383 RepID=UPI001AD84061|nr:hypothetical protein [Paraburkholderia dipogonis]
MKKEILPGTWRYIGQRLAGLDQDTVPIAGASLDEIYNYIGGTCYQIGRVCIDNAFVVERGILRLMYVRPDYRGYRRAAETVFATCPWKIDYDHALSRNLARQLGYKYVLLIRIVPGVNRSHGRFERHVTLPSRIPGLSFPDSRILDKWLGRRPDFMRQPAQAYTPQASYPSGLTLKQKGMWGFALGVDDVTTRVHHLRPYCLPLPWRVKDFTQVEQQSP